MTESHKNTDAEEEMVFEVKQGDYLNNLNYLIKKQKLIPGLLVALACGIISIAVWIALLKTFPDYKFGWVAIAAGFGIGFSLRLIGKGVTPVFGIAGALITLGTWLCGNFFTGALIFAKIQHVSTLTLLSHIDLDMVFFFLKPIIGPIDILVGSAAAYIAFYFGFKTVTPENSAN